MRRTWLVIAAVAVLAGLPVGGASAANPQPAWWSYDRAANFTTARTNTFVLVRDGTPIHCVVDQPADADGNALAGPFPALITVFTPYGGVNTLGALPGGDDFWSDHGYVAVACDIRGTGESGGYWQGVL